MTALLRRAAAFCLFCGVMWAQAQAQVEPETDLSGRSSLEEYLLDAREARLAQTLTPEKSLIAAEAARRAGQLTEAIAFAEAALSAAGAEPPKDPLHAGRTRLLLCRLLLHGLREVKALEQGRLALVLFEKTDEREAIALRHEALLRIGHASEDGRAALHTKISFTLKADTELSSTRSCYQEALSTADLLLAQNPGEPDFLLRRAEARIHLGRTMSKGEEDVALATRALADLARLPPAGDQLESPEDQFRKAEIYRGAAIVFARHSSKSSPTSPTPLELYAEAIQILEELVADFPHHQPARYALAILRLSVDHLKDSLSSSPKGAELRSLEDTLQELEELVRRDPENGYWLLQKARAHSLLYREEYETKDYSSALDHTSAMVEIQKSVLSPKRPFEHSTDRVYALSYAYRMHAFVLGRLERTAESVESYANAVEFGKKAALLAPGNMTMVNHFSSSSGYLARAFIKEEPLKAAAIYQTERQVMEKVIEKLGQAPENHLFHSNLASAYHEQAKLLESNEDLDGRPEITRLHRERVEHRQISRRLNPTCSTCNRGLWDAYHDYAVSLALETESHEDLTKLEEALRILEQGISKSHSIGASSAGSTQTYASKAMGTFEQIRRELRATLRGKSPAEEVE